MFDTQTRKGFFGTWLVFIVLFTLTVGAHPNAQPALSVWFVSLGALVATISVHFLDKFTTFMDKPGHRRVKISIRFLLASILSVLVVFIFV